MFGIDLIHFLFLYVHRYIIYIILFIGALKLIKVIFKFPYLIYIYFLRREYDLYKRYGGGYALVLGSTNGIGLQYCYDFAQRGFNLIMISRKMDLLEKRKKEIELKFPKIDIKIAKIDFIRIKNEDFINQIQLITKDLDVSVIVANAGPGRFNDFNKLDYSDFEMTIQVNVRVYTYICRILIPRLLLRKHKSAILFMSSGFETGNLPCANVYAGSKAYVMTLAKLLDLEYGKKIDVLSISLGEIEQEGYKPVDPCAPHAKNLPSQHFRFLGKTVVTAGNWEHAFMNWFMDTTKLYSSEVIDYLKKVDEAILKDKYKSQ